MKRKHLLLLLCSIFALLPCGASAQYDEQGYETIDSRDRGNMVHTATTEDGYRIIPRYHHDLRLGIGAPGIWQVAYMSLILPDVDINDNYYDPPTASDNLLEARTYDTPIFYITPISLEYSGYVKNWLLIGAKFSFSSLYRHKLHIATNKRFTTDANYGLSAMCNFRFEYLRRDIVRLYSGIGVGVATRFTKDELYATVPMFDLTYIGITLGRNFYGFGELGGGISGCVRFGFGYRF